MRFLLRCCRNAHGEAAGGLSAAPYRYWMSNVKVPIDIVFMDSSRQIVEICADTPPCTTAKKEDCPVYGGHHYEQYVLELGAGEAKRLGLQKGQTLSF